MQKILSIKEAELVENRVGKVILGYRDLINMRSRKSEKAGRSFTFKRFMFQSPPIKYSVFVLFRWFSTGSNSSINFCTPSKEVNKFL